MKFTEICITNQEDWRYDGDHARRYGGASLLVIGIESNFDQFLGLCRSGLPSPLVNGLVGGLRQKRMTAKDVSGLDGAVWGHDGFDADDAFDAKAAGDLRIGRNHFADYLAFRLGLILLRPGKTGENQGRRDYQQSYHSRSSYVHNGQRIAVTRAAPKITMVTLRD
jgi:hypothetical protein